MDLSKVPLNAPVRYGRDSVGGTPGSISLSTTSLTLTSSEGERLILPLRAFKKAVGSKDLPTTNPANRYKLQLQYDSGDAQSVLIVQFINPQGYDESATEACTNSPAALAKAAYLAALKQAIAPAKPPSVLVKTETPPTTTTAPTAPLPTPAAARGTAVALAPLSVTAPTLPTATAAAQPTPVTRPLAAPVSVVVHRRVREARERVLKDKPELQKLYDITVGEKTISEEDFWQVHAPEALASISDITTVFPVAAIANQLLGGSKKPVASADDDSVQSALVSAEQWAIFVDNPEVHLAYKNNVPEKMSSLKFWELYEKSPNAKYVGGITQAQLETYIKQVRDSSGGIPSTPGNMPFTSNSGPTPNPSPFMASPITTKREVYDIFMQAKLQLAYQQYLRGDTKTKRKILPATVESKSTDTVTQSADAAAQSEVETRAKSLDTIVKSEDGFAKPAARTVAPTTTATLAPSAATTTTTCSSKSPSSSASSYVASVLAAEDHDTLDWHSAPDADLASVSADVLRSRRDPSAGGVTAVEVEAAKKRSKLLHSLNRLGVVSVTFGGGEAAPAPAAGNVTATGGNNMVVMELQSLDPEKSVVYQVDDLTNSRDFSEMPEKSQKILPLTGVNMSSVLSADDETVAPTDGDMTDSRDRAAVTIEYNLSSRKRRKVAVNLPWLSDSAQKHEVQFATVDPRVLPCNAVTASTLAGIMTSAHRHTTGAADAQRSQLNQDVEKLTTVSLELCKHYWAANAQRLAAPAVGASVTEIANAPKIALTKMIRLSQRISHLMSTTGQLRAKLSAESNEVALQQLMLAETTMRQLLAHWEEVKPPAAGGPARPGATPVPTPSGTAALQTPVKRS